MGKSLTIRELFSRVKQELLDGRTALVPNQALATTRHLMRPSGGTTRQSSTYRRHLRREERD